MDKKKLLLVSVSVGLFLVIVIGVSILAFSPKTYSAVEAVRAEAGQRQIQPVAPGTTPSSDAPPPVAPLTAPEVTQLSAEEGVIRVTGDAAPPAPAVAEQPSGGITIAYHEVQNTPPEPKETAQETAQAPRIASVTVQPKPAVKQQPKPQTVQTAAAKPQSPPPQAKPQTAPAKPAVKKTSRTGDYWVQAGSFVTKSHADNARDFLADKGIAAIVQNGTVNGKIYYRVRVGPYATQSEANYWLSLVKTIDGMENSLVWKSPTNRT